MIYLVEDEQALNDLLVTYLKNSGYDVKSFINGQEAYECIDDKPDLWILDIMMPGMDGYTLIKHIKEKTPGIPVIFMSARSSELDRVLGLEMGSDDYLPKPFLPRELILRVQRILKVPQSEEMIQIGSICIKPNQRVVTYNDDTIDLTVKEYELLLFFSKNKNKALSRNDLLDSVWGSNYFGSERVIDDTLRRIRKKLTTINIQPVYGYGYIMKEEDDV